VTKDPLKMIFKSYKELYLQFKIKGNNYKTKYEYPSNKDKIKPLIKNNTKRSKISV